MSVDKQARTFAGRKRLHIKTRASEMKKKKEEYGTSYLTEFVSKGL